MKGRWQRRDGTRVFVDADGRSRAVIIRDDQGYRWFSGLDSGWGRTIAKCRQEIVLAWDRQKAGER